MASSSATSKPSTSATTSSSSSSSTATSTSTSTSTAARASRRRSKRDALAAGGQRGAILARRLAGRRGARTSRAQEPQAQKQQEHQTAQVRARHGPARPAEPDADPLFEAHCLDDAPTNIASASASPFKTPSTGNRSTTHNQSQSLDRTADLTTSRSLDLDQSDLWGALNISPVKKWKTTTKSPRSQKSGNGGSGNGSGSGSGGCGYARREPYNLDASPDAASDRMAMAAAAPLPSPRTPGTAAATSAAALQQHNSQERRRTQSSPGGSPHIIQQVGSDLTDDDTAHGSPYRHGSGGTVHTKDVPMGQVHEPRQEPRQQQYGQQGATLLGIGQPPGGKVAGSAGTASSNAMAKPPTTPGRRRSTTTTTSNRSSARSSPLRTPSSARGSPTRTPTATPPRPRTNSAQAQLRPSQTPRQLHSPPKRGIIPLHEAQAAVRAAAKAIHGSYAYAPRTAMDNSFERTIYGPGDATVLFGSATAGGSSSSNNSGGEDGDDEDGSGSGWEGDPLLDTSFESIVKEFTLDSSYVTEEAECELEEGEGKAQGEAEEAKAALPEDEIWMRGEGLDDLEVVAAKAKAKAKGQAPSWMAGAKTSSDNPNSPARSAGSRSSRSSSSSKVEQYIAAVQQEVREADARGEWVSFDDDAGSDGGGSSSAFGTPRSSGMDDHAIGAARVWPPPQTPTRSPPSSAGASPAKATEASPDRSHGLSTDGDEHTIPSVSTATEGTERTNNMTPSRPNMLVVSTPRRSPPRGIVTPSRMAVGATYGVSPGRFAAGVRLMDDDNTTIRTDDESYKFLTPQRAAHNGASAVPGTPVKPSTPLGLTSLSAGTPDTARDVSFESSNDLNVTLDTIQANNTTTSMMENEAAWNLSFDARSVESDALQTVDDKSLGTRVPASAHSDANSVVQEYNTQTGSKVLPGRSGYDNKEACGIFREFEDFLQSGLHLADEFADSVRDFSQRVGYMCVGIDEMRHLRNTSSDHSSSSGSSRRSCRSQRLNRIMSNQRLRRVSSNRSHATSESDHSPPRPVVGRVPSRTGHQVKESFAC